MSTVTAPKVETRNATIGVLSTATVSGIILATPTDVYIGTALNKIVTPGAVKAALQSYTSIGSSSSIGTFTDVTAESISGSIVATDLSSFGVVDKAVTPSFLKSAFAAAKPIGGTTPNVGSFINLNATSVSGAMRAAAAAISAGSSTTSILTPLRLKDSLAIPPPIGRVAPNTGTFATLTANVLSTSDYLTVAEGGTGSTTNAKGDLLVGNGSGSISKVSIGTNGQYLVADSNEPTGVKWTTLNLDSASTESVSTTDNIEALNTSITNKALSPGNVPTLFASPPTLGSGASNPTATFTNFTVNTELIPTNAIGIGAGATGIRSYAKGDVLIASNVNQLSKFPTTTTTGKFLTVDSAQPYGLSWTTISTLDPTAPQPIVAVADYPAGYMNTTFPTQVSGDKFSIEYINARDSLNVKNIDVSTSIYVNMNSIGSSVNGTVLPTSIRPGTVRVIDNVVYGIGTSFTSDFTAGGYIQINNANIKITRIDSDTRMIIDRPGACQLGSLTWLNSSTPTIISSDQKRYGDYSAYFNGSTYLNLYGVQGAIPKAWTIEFWIYPTSLSSNTNVFTMTDFIIQVQTTGTVSVVTGTRVVVFNSYPSYYQNVVTINNWTHLALVCSGTDYKMFINGKIAYYGLSSTAISPSSLYNSITLGSSFVGYIDDFRISNIPRYSTTFYTSNTAAVFDLHTISLNTFNDLWSFNSTELGGAALTPACRDASLQLMASTALSTDQAQSGSQSLYFTGSSYAYYRSTLSIVSAFTIDMWVYPTTLTGGFRLLQTMADGNGITITFNASGVVTMSVSSPGKYNSTNLSAIAGAGALTANQWNHLAITYSYTLSIANSGNFYVYINGVPSASLIGVAPAYAASLSNMCLGGRAVIGNQSNSYFTGYIDALWVSSTNRYADGVQFTVPYYTPFNDDYTVALFNFDTDETSEATSTGYSIATGVNISNANMYLYVAYDKYIGSGMFLSASNEKSGGSTDLPSGYATYAQLPYYTTFSADGLSYTGFTKLENVVENSASLTYVNSGQYQVNPLIAKAGRYDVRTTESIDLSSTFIDKPSPSDLLESTRLSGTVSVSGTAVTGTSTAFTSDFVVGDRIFLESTGGSYAITNVDSNTSITLATGPDSPVVGSEYRRQASRTFTVGSSTLSGTISIVNNIVVGSSTNFTSDFAAGDLIVIPSVKAAGRVVGVASGGLLLEDRVTDVTPTFTYTVSGAPYLSETIAKYGSTSLRVSKQEYVSVLKTPGSVYDSNKLKAFTIELWMYPTESTSTHAAIFGTQYTTLSGNTSYINCYHYSSNVYMAIQMAGTSVTTSTPGSATGLVTSPITTNAWNHVALCFDGFSFKLFVNGKLESLVTTYYKPEQHALSRFQLGADGSYSYANFAGYIDCVHVSTLSRYRTDFTPANFVSDTYTHWITQFESSGYTGSWTTTATTSNIEVTVTSVGSPSLTTTQTLFGSTRTLEMASASSQSVYIASTVTTPAVFTFEFWFYPTSGGKAVASLVNGGIHFYMPSAGATIWVWAPGYWGNIFVYSGSSFAPTQNSWNHMAFMYDGTNYYLCLNGTRGIITSSAYTMPTNLFQNIRMGGSSLGVYYDGSVSEVHVSSCVRYTGSTYTVPSAAFVGDDFTVILDHFDGATTSVSQGVDYSRQTTQRFNYNNSTTFTAASMAPVTISPTVYESYYGSSNTMLSTTRAKFGTTSALMNASYINVQLDLLALAAISDIPSWTLEYWFYSTSMASQGNTLGLMSTREPNWLTIRASSTQVTFTTGNGSALGATTNGTSSNLSLTGNWAHFAVTCNKLNSTTATYKVFINGAQEISTTGTLLTPSCLYNLYIGYDSSAGGYRLVGHIDEFRFSNTIRYTDAFTPASTQHVVDNRTIALNHFEGPSGFLDLNVSEVGATSILPSNTTFSVAPGESPYTSTGLTYYKITAAQIAADKNARMGTTNIVGTLVTGANTNFISDFNVGDTFYAPSLNNGAEVLSILDNNYMLLKTGLSARSSRSATYTTIGACTLSASQKKFGKTSLYFDQYSYLMVDNLYADTINPRTYWTIEFWMYYISGNGNIFGSSASGNTDSIKINVTSSTGPSMIIGNRYTLTGASSYLFTRRWTHVAVTYNGRTCTLYIDGNPVANSTTAITPLPDTFYRFYLGADPGSSQGLTGYIDDFRISKNVRYTTRFVPPTTPFTLDADTFYLNHFNGLDGSTSMYADTDYAWGVKRQPYWRRLGWQSNYTFTSTASSITTTGKYVVGTGTSFNTTLTVGDVITIGNEKRPVTGVYSSTLLTLQDSAVVAQTSPTWTTTSFLSNATGMFSTTSLVMSRPSSAAVCIPWTAMPPQWTLEFYFNLIDRTGISTLIAHGDNNGILKVYVNNSGLYISLGFAPGSWNITQDLQSNSTPALNTWHHLAIVFTGTAYIVYMNGAEEMRATSSQPLPNSMLNNLTFGVDPFSTSDTMNGYVDEFRFSKAARYTSTFTPSASAFRVDADTLSLCHFDASIASYNDLNAIESVKSVPGSFVPQTYLQPNSAVAWGCITNAHITPMVSKFGISSLYAPLINSTRAGASFGANVANPAQWTLEVYYNPTTTTNSVNIFSLATYARSSGQPLQVYLTSSSMNIAASSNGTSQNISGTGTISLTTNVWHHIAVVFDGNAYLGFFDGSLVVTTTGSAIYQSNAFAQGYLGLAFWDGSRYSDGYYDEFRFSSTTRYLAGFTPSNAPFTWDSSTISLCHFDSDRFVIGQLPTNINILEDTGAAQSATWTSMSGIVPQISQAYAKFGDGSLTIDRNTRYAVLTQPITPTAWTIDFWLYPREYKVSGYSYILSTSSGLLMYVIHTFSSHTLTAVIPQSGSALILSMTAPLLETWTHIALVYDPTAGYALYANGTALGSSVSSNTTASSSPLTEIMVGAYMYQSSSTVANNIIAQVDEFRLSSIARWPAAIGNFTPAGPYVKDSYTLSLAHFDLSKHTRTLASTDEVCVPHSSTPPDAIWTNTTLSDTQSKYGNASLQCIRGNTPATVIIPATLATSWSIDFWAFFSDLDDQAVLTSKSGNVTITLSGEQIVFEANNGGLLASLTSSTVIVDTWVHIMVVFDATVGYRLYVDGLIEDYTSTTTKVKINELSELAVGGDLSDLDAGLNGYIDQFRVSNVSRSISGAVITDGPYVKDMNTVALAIFNIISAPSTFSSAPTTGDLPGLVYWLDASDSSSVTFSSGDLSAVTDKSLSNYTTSVIGPGDVPTQGSINSLDAIQFSGAGNQSIGVSGPSPLSTLTAFIVFRFTGKTTLQELWSPETVASNTDILGLDASGSALIRSVNAQATTGFVPEEDTTYIATVVDNGSCFDIYVNGTYVASSNTAMNISTRDWSSFRLGGSSSSTYKAVTLPTAYATLDQSLSLNDNDAVATWGIFSQSTSGNRPVYKTSGGMYGGSYVQLTNASSQFLTVNNFTIDPTVNGGWTAIAIVRFRGSPVSNEAVFDFGASSGFNNNITLRRSGTSSGMNVQCWNGWTQLANFTVANCIVQDQWAVYVVRHGLTSKVTELILNRNVIGSGTGNENMYSRGVNYNYIGRNIDGSGYANMDIGGFYFYNYKLTDAQLASFYYENAFIQDARDQSIYKIFDGVPTAYSLTDWQNAGSPSLTVVQDPSAFINIRNRTIDGLIGEFQLYNSVLLDTLRKKIEWSLMSKWGISYSLPESVSVVNVDNPVVYNKKTPEWSLHRQCAYVGGSRFGSSMLSFTRLYNSYARVKHQTPPSELWTMQMWFYGNVSGVRYTLAAGAAPYTFELFIDATNGNKLSFTAGNGYSWSLIAAGVMLSATAPSMTQWNHVALSYDSLSGYRMFLNGVQTATYFITGKINPSYLMDIYLGSNASQTTLTSASSLDGYIDEFSLSGDVPQMTNKINVPTSPLLPDANTICLQHFNTFSPVQATNGLGWSSLTNETYNTSGLTVSNAQVKFGTGALYCPSITSYSGMVSPVPSGAWTIELWMYATSIPNNATFCWSGSGSMYLRYSGTSNTVIAYVSSGGGVGWNIMAGSGTVAAPINQWNHLALVFTGSAYMLFVNGQISVNTTNSSIADANIWPNFILSNNGSGFVGYIDEFRISSTARYTNTFTVPATDFAMDAMTIVLNKFNIQPSPSTYTVTNAVPSTTITRYGQSCLVGDGKYFSMTMPSTPSAWTVEMWVNIDTLGSVVAADETDNYPLFAAGTFGAQLSVTPAGVLILNTGNGDAWLLTLTDSVGISIDTWTHVAVTFDGTTYTIYKNGLSVQSSAGAALASNNFSPMAIGANTSNGYVVYIDDLRVSNSLRYTSAFIPPISFERGNDAYVIACNPFEGTTVTNSELNTLTPVSQAQPLWLTYNNSLLSNTQAKFGTTSIQCTTAPKFFRVRNLTLTPAAWTVEFWIYPLTLASNRNLLESDSYYGIRSYYDASGALITTISTNGISYDLTLSQGANGTVAINSWMHLAYVFTGTSYLVFKNGSQVQSLTSSTAMHINGFNGFTFGWSYQSGGSPFDGYVDELRISNVARYSSGFTAPSSAFSWDADTVVLQHFEGVSGTTGFTNDSTDLVNNMFTTQQGMTYTSSFAKFGVSSISLGSGGVRIENLMSAAPATVYSNPENTNFPSGLTLWLDASDGSSVTGTTSVSQWNDKSGNSYNAMLSSVGTTSPSLVSNSLNGKSTISFGGSGNKFFTSTLSSTPSKFSAFTVARFSSKTNYATLFNTSGAWTTGSVGVLLNGTTYLQYAQNLTSSVSYNTVFNATAGAWFVLSMVDNGDSARLYINGMHVGTANSLNTMSRILSLFDIGGWTADTTRTLNGGIAEMQLYNRALSDSDRQSIEAYLGAKWGISVDIRYGYNLDQWTIELFAWPIGVGNGNYLLAGNNRTAGTYEGLTLQYQTTTNSLVCWINSQPSTTSTADIANNSIGTGASPCGASPMIPGQWNHVLMSFTGSAYVLYVNGVLSGYVYSSIKMSSNFWNTLTLSTFWGTAWNGYIDELRISNISRVSSIPSLMAEHISTNKMSMVSNAFDLSTIADGEYACPHVPVTSYTTSGTPMMSYSNYKFGISSLQVDDASYVQINGLTVPSTWTIEFWFQLRTLYSGELLHNDNINLSVTPTSMSLSVSNNFGVVFDQGFSTPITTNWTHVAVVFTGNNYILFLNGRLLGSTETSTNVVGFTALKLGYSMDGYIDELRISSIPRYFGNFELRAGEFLADDKCILLNHFNKDVPRLPTDFASGEDAGRMEYSLQTGGSPKIDYASTSFFVGPYGSGGGLTASQKKYGNSSGFFSNIQLNNYPNYAVLNKYIVVPKTWTLEFFFYPTNVSSSFYLVDRNFDSGTNMMIQPQSSGLILHSFANITLSSAYTRNTVNYNAWNHYALQFDGYTYSVCLNGVISILSVTSQNLNFHSFQGLIIGRNMGGYVDDFRISDTIRYPTGLMQYPTHSFYHYSAEITNTQYKFGTSSLYIGVNSMLCYPSTTPPIYSWTLESWLWTADTNNGRRVLSDRYGQCVMVTLANTTTRTLGLYLGTTAYLWDIANNVTSSVSYTASAWNHIALVFTGTSYILFINGAVGITVSSTAVVSSSAWANGPGCGTQGSTATGYYDEFRFSTTARYTSTFTPSESAFIMDDNTSILEHFDGNRGTITSSMLTQYNDTYNYLYSLLVYVVPSSTFVWDANTLSLCHYEGSTLYDVILSEDLNNLNQVISASNTPVWTSQGGAQMVNTTGKHGTGSLILSRASSQFAQLSGPVIPDQWTIELYAWPLDGGVNAGLFASNGVSVSIGTDDKLAITLTGVTTGASSGALTINDYNHIALSYDGSYYRAFVGGIKQFEHSSSTPATGGFADFTLGKTGSYYFNGYIDSFRVSNMCRYTSTFTPGTISKDLNSLSMNSFNISGASGSALMSSEEVRGVPGGTWSIVNNGGVVTTALARFGNGCLSMTGGFAQLMLSQAIIPTAWTIEFWFWPTATSQYTHFANVDGSVYLQHVNNQTQVIVSINGSSSSAITIPNYKWSHFAMVYSIDTLYTYINGSMVKSGVMAYLQPARFDNWILGYGNGTRCFFDAFNVSKVAKYSGMTLTMPTTAPVRDINTIMINNFDVAASGNNAPNFSDDLVIYGRNLTTYSTLKRPFISNPYLYLYGIGKSNGSTVMLSTANVKAGGSISSVPSGYSTSNAVQTPYAFALDKLGGFIPSTWQLQKATYVSPLVITVPGGSWIPLDLSPYIPSTATTMVMRVLLTTTATTYVNVQLSYNNNGSTPKTIMSGIRNASSSFVNLSVTSTQLYVNVSDTSSTATITILGYSTFNL